MLFYGCLQLGGLDIQCTRNIYGRQISSFEGKIKLQEPSLYGKDVRNSDEFHGIFIRAPGVAKVYSSSVKILATLADAENSIVAVQQNNMIATCFHPELTNDSRLAFVLCGEHSSQQILFIERLIFNSIIHVHSFPCTLFSLHSLNRKLLHMRIMH